MYVVSYDNEWHGDDYVDKKVYVVCTYVNENVKKELETWASHTTCTEESIEIELCDDELKEIEE